MRLHPHQNKSPSPKQEHKGETPHNSVNQRHSRGSWSIRTIWRHKVSSPVMQRILIRGLKPNNRQCPALWLTAAQSPWLTDTDLSFLPARQHNKDAARLFTGSCHSAPGSENPPCSPQKAKQITVKKRKIELGTRVNVKRNYTLLFQY